MTFLSRLLNPIYHCEDAARHLLSSLGVKFTLTHLQKKLIEHPDYPGLNAISGVLSNYGISSEAYKIKSEHFDKLPLPFIAYIKGTNVAHGLFAPVYKVSQTGIELYNPETQKQETWHLAQIKEQYQDIVLALDAETAMEEVNYEGGRKWEKRKNAINYSIALGMPLLAILICFLSIMPPYSLKSIFSLIPTLLILAGTIITTLLVWQELDNYNPAIKQICQATKNINCTAVLRSRGAKIFGLSWASLGFTFFTGQLIFLTTSGVTNAVSLQLCSWLNIAALPYIVYSIYYQWRIVKQWCLLCLFVQAVIFSLGILSLAGGLYHLVPLHQIPITGYLSLVVSVGIVFSFIMILVPALEKAKSYRHKTMSLQQLKHNQQIFETLLSRQTKIEEPADDLGIFIGNPNAAYKIVKVCSPYCPPCAMSHPVIEEILKSNDNVSLRIIFTAQNTAHSKSAQPVRHLLAINDRKDTALMEKALDDWYLAKEKDYNAFAEKYPVEGDFASQNKKLDAMSGWCKTNKIRFTPTFYINGHQLPEIYDIYDLKYFLG